jgi:hypothetical protein
MMPERVSSEYEDEDILQEDELSEPDDIIEMEEEDD